MKDIKRGPDAIIGLTEHDLAHGREDAIRKLDNFLFDQAINYGYGTVVIGMLAKDHTAIDESGPSIKMHYGDRRYELETENGRQSHNHGDDCARAAMMLMAEKAAGPAKS